MPRGARKRTRHPADRRSVQVSAGFMPGTWPVCRAIAAQTRC